jgi:hypothetical protein
MTRRIEIDFKVREYENGEPFILMEEIMCPKPVPELEGKTITFDLAPGCTADEARHLEEHMRRIITHFAITD